MGARDGQGDLFLKGTPWVTKMQFTVERVVVPEAQCWRPSGVDAN
jgi:hypothetical protein